VNKSSNPTGRRKHRKLSTCFAILALFIQMAMPFAQVVAATPTGADNWNGAPQVICSALGGLIKTAALEPNRGSPLSQASPACEYCLNCQVSLNGTIASGPLVVEILESEETTITWVRDFAIRGPLDEDSSRQVRAPPVQA